MHPCNCKIYQSYVDGGMAENRPTRTTIAGLAASLLGTYMFIVMFEGFGPKLRTGVSADHASDAKAANIRSIMVSGCVVHYK
jgi:hypothetical protein